MAQKIRPGWWPGIWEGPIRPFVGRVPDTDTVITGGGGGGASRRSFFASKQVIGMVIFVISEFMLFMSLISAFLFARLGHDVWPPPGQPRLPMAFALFNMALLFASSLTFHHAVRRIRTGDYRGLLFGLRWTLGLGTAFLLLQGFQWWRLIAFGLRMTQNLFGATFYVVIGMHALHMLIAMAAVWLLLRQARQRRFSARNHAPVVAWRIFWDFIVFMWPVIFLVVYVV